jgi:hypothetical protein
MVSFICTTYRRFYCVRRILAQFYAQTYPNKELIIFNTDMEFPYEMLVNVSNVIMVNNDKDYQTGLPYTNRGQICRDAVTHASGEYFMLADDDDIYLPYHLEQAVKGIKSNGMDAWKPEKSLFATREEIKLVQNTLEASVIVKMNRIREIGFRSDITGYEGLSWYTKLRDEGQLDENNKKYVPSYCFNWSDPTEIAGHKQSGDIDNPNNFDIHKEQSKDVAKYKLTPISREELDKEYLKYYDCIVKYRNEFDTESYKTYILVE